MNRAAMNFLFATALCASAAAAQGAAQPEPIADASNAGAPIAVQSLAQLELRTSDGMLRATVRGAEPGFFGIVLLSLSPQQQHFLVDLPPILADFAVMGAGYTAGHELEFKVPCDVMQGDQPALYGQAITFSDQGLAASGVVQIEEN